MCVERRLVQPGAGWGEASEGHGPKEGRGEARLKKFSKSTGCGAVEWAGPR